MSGSQKYCPSALRFSGLYRGLHVPQSDKLLRNALVSLLHPAVVECNSQAEAKEEQKNLDVMERETRFELATTSLEG